MEMLIEVICEGVDLFTGIIFDVLEAKCIKKGVQKEKADK